MMRRFLGAVLLALMMSAAPALAFTAGDIVIYQDTTGANVQDANGIGAAVRATPALTSNAYNQAFSALYSSAVISGNLSTTNTLALPSGNVLPANYDTCSDTSLAPGASQMNPLILNCRHIYMPGIGTGTGDRDGLGIDMAITGTTTQTEGAAYFNGAIATIVAWSNLGGTSLSQIGDVYGFSTQISLNSGATYYASVHGAGEWDLAVKSGASVTNKIGAEIALVTGDDVQGSNMDTALLLSNSGSTAWKFGIALGTAQGGSFPIASNGSIIGSYQGGSAENGLAFSNITFSNCAVQTEYNCLFNKGLSLGSATLPSGALLSVNTATNDDLDIFDGTAGNLGSGVLLDVLNDAANTKEDFEIQASTIRFTPSVQLIVAGTLNLGGVSGAGSAVNYVCVDSMGLVKVQSGAC